MSLAFKPIGILSGLLAGLIGKRIFELLWGVVDDEDAPEPKHREIAIGKLVRASTAKISKFSVKNPYTLSKRRSRPKRRATAP